MCRGPRGSPMRFENTPALSSRVINKSSTLDAIKTEIRTSQCVLISFPFPHQIPRGGMRIRVCWPLGCVRLTCLTLPTTPPTPCLAPSPSRSDSRHQSQRIMHTAYYAHNVSCTQHLMHTAYYAHSILCAQARVSPQQGVQIFCQD